MKHLFAAFTIVLTLGLSTANAGFTDWQIDPVADDWASGNSTRLFYEDWKSGGGGFVGPGWGGQAFDVEAIYAAHYGSSVEYAIVTGFDPLNGVLHSGVLYTSGDVFFDIGASGWTTAVDVSTLSGGTADLYDNVVGTDPTIAAFVSSAPFDIGSGDLIGTAPLSISQDGAHFLIEGILDLAALGAIGADVGIHWTMSCGNDVGEGFISPPPVPEPGTVALLGLGGGIIALRQRRRSGNRPTS